MIERIVSARLQAASVPHIIKATARDLGVQLTLRKGRRTGILQARLKASGQRLRAITRLVKLDKAARRLSTSGALPQAFWGSEVIGISPTSLRAFRSLFASTSGINQASRCATTAIRIALNTDPAVDYLLRAVKSMLRALRLVLRSKLAPKLRTAWANAHEAVVGQEAVAPHTLSLAPPPAPRWGVVAGPVAAFIASLTPYGWKVPNPQRWIAPFWRNFCY